MNGLRALCLGLCLVAAPAKAVPIVEGYVSSVHGLEATLSTSDLKPYTHVALAFVNPDMDGQFVSNDAMACMTDRMLVPVPTAEVRGAITHIHAAGRKALAALGGGIMPKCAGDWADLISPAKREQTVSALAAFADEYQLDGLAVDFEGDLLAKTVHDGTYTPFVQALAARLHARHKTLSGTTSSWVGGMIPLTAIPAFDTVEVMSYDNPIPGGEMASMAKYRSELYLWLGRGVARDKLVMGVPFYGRGSGTYKPGYAWRDIAAEFGGQASAGDVIGQMCAGCSYITYNSPATLTEKARWAKAKAGGVMVWELFDDTPDRTLIKAVHTGLNASAPAPSAPLPAVASAGRPLNTPDVRAWVIYGTQTYGLVNDPKMPNGNALRITVARPTENNWDIGISAPLSGAVKAGETVDFAVWARLKTTDPDTQLDIPAVVQLAAAPYKPLLQGTITVTAQWQLLHIRGVVTEDHAAGTLSAALQLGNAMKVIDLGPATITALFEPHT